MRLVRVLALACALRVEALLVGPLRALPSSHHAIRMTAATKPAGRQHTAESRAKISAANKGRTPWNAGKQHSDETRQRIAEGTRLAYQRKVEAKQRERERLEREDPEAFAALLAEEAAAAQAAAASSTGAASHMSSAEPRL